MSPSARRAGIEIKKFTEDMKTEPSPSARRAGIEISARPSCHHRATVALREEGGD